MDSGQDHLLLHHLPVLVQASVNAPHLPLQYQPYGYTGYREKKQCGYMRIRILVTDCKATVEFLHEIYMYLK
jgi:hypothetical protein